MDSFKSQIDLFLTEISIELLGNKIYDINGTRQDKLVSLFKALPETNNVSEGNLNENDFLCSIGYPCNYTKNNKSAKAFLNDQLDYILKSANTSPGVNKEIMEFLRSYRDKQNKLTKDVDNVNLSKSLEKNQLVRHFNKKRYKILQKNCKKNVKAQLLDEYYREERDELLKLSMDTIRLIKYIINDSRNDEAKKGELIGFIHAMRSVKDQIYPDSSVPAKPYSRRPTQS